MQITKTVVPPTPGTETTTLTFSTADRDSLRNYLIATGVATPANADEIVSRVVQWGVGNIPVVTL